MNLAERVLYRDAMMLVLNKPAGLSCTPAGPPPHLTKHLAELTFGKTTLPQVAHRLDRDTTGCLLLGRHARALRELARLFQERRVHKSYWALVKGLWPPNHQRIEEAIDGREAVTLVRLLGSSQGCSWLELQPLTGRTHQLRIHCANLGHPILGDNRYGRGDGPLRLHSRSLEIPLYPKKAPIRVEAPLPSDWPALNPDPDRPPCTGN